MHHKTIGEDQTLLAGLIEAQRSVEGLEVAPEQDQPDAPGFGPLNGLL